MALKTLRFKIPPELAGRRLDDALIALLSQAKGPDLSKGQARKLIVAGAVYLNRRRVRIASKAVIVGAEVEAHIDFERIQTSAQKSVAHRPGWVMNSDAILFEDEWLIAINKPAGLPTQPTLDEARLNLYAALQKFVRDRDSDPRAYVGLHHRLDRDTSGVVLFTKKKEANPGVADLFSKHLAQKEYRALCTGPWISGTPKRAVGDRFEVRNFLKRLPGKVSRFGSARSGGDSAHTDFQVETRLGDFLWEFRCWPRTGRTHQIRVHLSELGLPIAGDLTYSAPFISSISRVIASKDSPRLMLHASSLEFVHPLTGEKLRIESSLPSDYLQFKKALGS